MGPTPPTSFHRAPRAAPPPPPPRSSALQQPRDILINDERDARAREHPDDVRGQAAIKARHALVRPGVRDRGWDGAVMGAREDGVVLLTFVSLAGWLAARMGGRKEGGT
jgi:hypothetical protein